ncbi:DUF3885 domain-containing protein [Mucilaginibacter aquatilis]|uniref:DUF3885 domain-containing protein n=1 Tax=Mucilaginibacter aquatilis TaxID=1517760 RepID=A0A6I4IAV8_9SPHI|nr:DUF3885 domain-containing protein [Mucilaginibacter aquatilis]MVN91068.1 DUF3885 domain-containing protein [Mucilaginibacter aquatilis]
MALFKQLRDILSDLFNGLTLVQPLFFNEIPAIRFELQPKIFDTGNDEYMLEVAKRINRISSLVISSDDQIFLYYNFNTWRKRKIRKWGYLFKQFRNNTKLEYQFRKRKHPTYNNGFHKAEGACQLIVKDKACNINFENIFTSIANNDFFIKPRIEGELYIVNETKKCILFMYDDRGCDLVSYDILFLQNIYTEFSQFVLEANREEIKRRLLINK